MEDSDRKTEKLEQQHDKLAGKFNRLYTAGKGGERDAMAAAVEKAPDLDQTFSDAQQLREETRESLHPARLGSGTLSSLATVLELTGNMLHSLGAETKEQLACKTGLTLRLAGDAVISEQRASRTNLLHGS